MPTGDPVCFKCGNYVYSSGGCPCDSVRTYVYGSGLVPHKCPVCDGTGKVSRPPWVAGDVPTWTDSGTGPYECRACLGKGIVWG